MKKTAIPVAASFLVGVFLCAGGFLLTGWGHGTYIPLGLCASPTILVFMLSHGSAAAFWIGLALAPFYWALLAFVATGSCMHRRSLLVSLLCAQYAGGPLLYWWFGETPRIFGEVFRVNPVVPGVFGLLYIVVHVLLWRSIANIQRQAASTSVQRA